MDLIPHIMHGIVDLLIIISIFQIGTSIIINIIIGIHGLLYHIGIIWAMSIMVTIGIGLHGTIHITGGIEIII
jgi:hypothetical protein